MSLELAIKTAWQTNDYFLSKYYLNKAMVLIGIEFLRLITLFIIAEATIFKLGKWIWKQVKNKDSKISFSQRDKP